MKAKTFEEFEVGVEEIFNNAENNNPSTKLERRRRIEELNDEKKLREELCEFA